jgi:hypothetical protein
MKKLKPNLFNRAEKTSQGWIVYQHYAGMKIPMTPAFDNVYKAFNYLDNVYYDPS